MAVERNTFDLKFIESLIAIADNNLIIAIKKFV
jgi:hypothetical protein